MHTNYGVDQENKFMVVGLKGINFFRLMDAKDCSFHYDRSTLDIQPVTQATIGRLSLAMGMQFDQWEIFGNEARKGFMGALHHSLAFHPHSQLYVVTGKIAGTGEVTVTHKGSGPEKFLVAVLSSKSYDLAFNFLQCRNASGKMISRTSWTPVDGQTMLDTLNRVYGPQTNITFDLKSADWVKIEKDLGNPLSEASFRSNGVAQNNNGSADLNLYFVDKWVRQGNSEKFGSYLPDLKVALLEDDLGFLPVTQGADPFAVLLAHEVAHFLQNAQVAEQGRGKATGHVAGQNVLFCEDIESTKINRALVESINH